MRNAKASTRVAILLRPYKAVCLASFDMSDRYKEFEVNRWVYNFDVMKMMETITRKDKTPVIQSAGIAAMRPQIRKLNPNVK